MIIISCGFYGFYHLCYKQSPFDFHSIKKDFNKEQEEFIKTNKKTGPIKPPWVGFKDEEQLKEQILQLSKDKRNFLRAPPAGAQFEFDYQVMNR